MVLPGIYGCRGRYLVIIRILIRTVIVRLFAFFWLRIQNPMLNYDKYRWGWFIGVGLS